MRINPDFDFRHLPAPARVRLAQDLWDSLTAEELEAELVLDDEQAAELDRRLAALDAEPQAGVPWEQLRVELEAELASMRKARPPA